MTYQGQRVLTAPASDGRCGPWATVAAPGGLHSVPGRARNQPQRRGGQRYVALQPSASQLTHVFTIPTAGSAGHRAGAATGIGAGAFAALGDNYTDAATAIAHRRTPLFKEMLAHLAETGELRSPIAADPAGRGGHVGR